MRKERKVKKKRGLGAQGQLLLDIWLSGAWAPRWPKHGARWAEINEGLQPF